MTLQLGDWYRHRDTGAVGQVIGIDHMRAMVTLVAVGQQAEETPFEVVRETVDASLDSRASLREPGPRYYRALDLGMGEFHSDWMPHDAA